MGKQQLGSQIEADQLSARDYVHLHNHTHHSLLDGLTKIPELVDRVKDLGMDAERPVRHHQSLDAEPRPD